MTHTHKGLLISIEGIDGSGKSSLVKNIQERFQSNYLVLTTKEPGGSELGKLLRTVLLEKSVSMCAKAQFLLFAADRAQHFHEIIIPALKKGALVISDRMADSSLVYQGYAQGLSLVELAHINQWAMNDYLPDITFFVKVDSQIAFERIKARNEPLTNFEKQEQLIQKAAEGFKEIFKDKKNSYTLDGTKTQEILAEEAAAIISSYLEHQKI